MTGEIRFKVDGEVLASTLACPVCFNVPRELPIPQCPAGHIVCKKCRPQLRECPTCRRRLFADNHSSIAAYLIDQVPHNCKFNEFGCKDKGLLSEIVIHEKKCPERTVRCAIKGCSEVVQLKKFPLHTKECFSYYREENRLENSVVTTLSRNFLKWDGESKVPRQEFDLETDRGTDCLSFMQLDKRVYVYKGYSSEYKYFFFCVLIGEEKEVAERYLATIEVFNKDSKMSASITCPVLPLDEFPESTLDMIESPGVWKIPYETIRNLFKIEEIEKEENSEDNLKKWKVTYLWKSTIKEN